MKRRTLLQWIAGAAASLPFLNVRLAAAVGELSPGQLLVLRDVAGTVLPASLGPKATDAAVDGFVRWMRGYREGVPLSHGYGDPQLVRTGPTPVPGYARQITALEDAARARGGRFGALGLNVRRVLLDGALTSAGVRGLPARPDGTHVVSDLMAHYFRSSAATDLCYNAHIGRNTYRAIEVTTVRPKPLAG